MHTSDSAALDGGQVDAPRYRDHQLQAGLLAANLRGVAYRVRSSTRREISPEASRTSRAAAPAKSTNPTAIGVMNARLHFRRVVQGREERDQLPPAALNAKVESSAV